MANRYTFDEDVVAQSISQFGSVLNRSGLNLKDNITTIMKYYSRDGYHTADPPIIGKTYIFMTRPDLNFRSIENLTGVPTIQFISGTRIGRWLLAMLQRPGGEFIGENRIRETLSGGTNISNDDEKFLDTCFIPLISNTCVNSTGGKDLTMSVFETTGDFVGNRLTYARGGDEVFSTGEITLNFHDVYTSPVLLLHVVWYLYIHYCAKGRCVPALNHILERSLDYTVSIYIIMTDQDGVTIQRFIKYTGCFPRSVPFGAIQHSTTPNIEALREVSITYSYNRYEPMNPQILSDFNYISKEFVFDGVEPVVGIGALRPYTKREGIPGDADGREGEGVLRRFRKKDVEPDSINLTPTVRSIRRERRENRRRRRDTDNYSLEDTRVPTGIKNYRQPDPLIENRELGTADSPSDIDVYRHVDGSLIAGEFPEDNSGLIPNEEYQANERWKKHPFITDNRLVFL